MFAGLIDRAVQLRLIVILALAGLCAFAALMIPRLNLDAFPDVTNIPKRRDSPLRKWSSLLLIPLRP